MPRIDGLLQPFDDEAKTDTAPGFVTELAFRVPVLKPKGTIITEAATTQFHQVVVFAGSSPLHAITGHVATAKPAEVLGCSADWERFFSPPDCHLAHGIQGPATKKRSAVVMFGILSLTVIEA